MINLKPLHDHVVVKRLEGQEVSKGGIVIPDVAREKPQKGKVLAVGPGRLDEDGGYRKMQVEVGQTILFSKYGGNEFELDGEKVLILVERDIVAILDS
jgi:chaperonin GroES